MNNQQPFYISHAGRRLEVKPAGDRQFSIVDNGHTVVLKLQRDNEGALHWLEGDAESVTDLSAAVGSEIEKHFMQSNNPL